MRETRIVSTASLRIERRAAAEGQPEQDIIVGHASVFDEWATIYRGRYWEWREIIRPNAWSRAIRERQDVRSLFNHDANFLLGRTKSGTLLLREDDRGLLTETSPPDTQTIRDLVIAPIRRGDMDGMSFSFLPVTEGKKVETEMPDGTLIVETPGLRTTYRFEGERLIEEDEVLDADLFDISPVVFPAYKGTDLSMRGWSRDIEDRIKRMDQPHSRPAPRREEFRRRLEASGVLPVRATAPQPDRRRSGVNP